MKHFFHMLVFCLPCLSAHCQQPFDCGFYHDTRSYLERDLKPWLTAIRFEKGDTVASIGAGNGWVEAAYAVKLDEVIFYLEDTDSTCLNISELEKVSDWYTGLRGAPLTCKMIPVLGTETNTRLPSGIFDKVLLSGSFHHFSHPAAMLAECRRILAPDGRLFISEHLVRKSGLKRKKFCDDPLLSGEDLEHIFSDQGFGTESVHKIRGSLYLFVLK